MGTCVAWATSTYGLATPCTSSTPPPASIPIRLNVRYKDQAVHQNCAQASGMCL
ncbi:hypothetical protein PF005_g13913 [Phytophthora fragariae]|uniref:Uncharacterized protein n=1 Tax=Phytophthora fragariae TaxID=53985 RepID=A0A6A3K7C9_9STRA|nr:hypothetical protein PF003_g40276 [Phytophthora fragariae]KAE8940846.1 hypothetical protein PF009_g9356 [Phytophthora fragariae]KAE9003540.1 hypothetical protein PF011_g12857 [Phytophthora fragariae]KAE9103692.1 hypothetical protein PF010_g13647 [Phytophthora fragariae]KAE9118664.1 hypothetical protein PF007_g8849 [Phytophthora fragariae]